MCRVVSGQSNGSSSAVRQLISRGFGERARRIVRGIPETENRYRIWPFSPSRSFPLDADLINNGSAPDPLPPPPPPPRLFSAQPLLGYNTLNNRQRDLRSPVHPGSLSPPSLSFSRFDLNWNVRNKGEEWRERARAKLNNLQYLGLTTPPHKGLFTPD